MLHTGHHLSSLCIAGHSCMRGNCKHMASLSEHGCFFSVAQATSIQNMFHTCYHCLQTVMWQQSEPYHRRRCSQWLPSGGLGYRPLLQCQRTAPSLLFVRCWTVGRSSVAEQCTLLQDWAHGIFKESFQACNGSWG